MEEVVQREDKTKPDAIAWDDNGKEQLKAHRLDDVVHAQEIRMQSPDSELNRVLGGGLVPGSVVLVAGDPGIGKSTLFLQCALQWKNIITLYVSGEESTQQIKLRADRIGIKNNNLYLLTATATDTIFQEIKKLKPNLLIIDSIQTLESPYVGPTLILDNNPPSPIKKLPTLAVMLPAALILPTAAIGPDLNES